MGSGIKVKLQQCLAETDTSLENRFLQVAQGTKAKAYRATLKHFILALPEVIQQTRIWFESEATPSDLKKLYGYVLTYVYHTLDFLPEEEYGFWGYLDDAYFAGLVFQQAIAFHPEDAERVGQGFLDQLGDWLAKTREVIPQQTQALDGVFERLLAGDTRYFHEALVS